MRQLQMENIFDIMYEIFYIMSGILGMR